MSPIRTARLLLAVLLLPALLLAAACSSGGAGGEGSEEPREPTEAEVREAEEALKAQEQAVEDTVAQARVDLEAAIAAIDPCDPSPDQITAVTDPLGILQSAGVAPDSMTEGAMQSLAPVIRSLARAQANGMNSGMSPSLITSLAIGAGLDPSQPDWMGDPDCTEQWRLEMTWTQSLAGAIPLSLTFEGHTDFLASDGGGFVSAPGPVTVEGALIIPDSPCTFTMHGGDGTMSLAGGHFLPQDEFRMEVRSEEIAFTTTMQCPDPLPTLSSPGEFVGLLMPVTIPAEDGASVTIPWQAPIFGDVTFTLRRLGNAAR